MPCRYAGGGGGGLAGWVTRRPQAAQRTQLYTRSGAIHGDMVCTCSGAQPSQEALGVEITMHPSVLKSLARHLGGSVG